MSWSITVDNLHEHWDKVFEENTIAYFISHNPEYFDDLCAAVELARSLGLGSATLAGGRTPTPGSDDEVVVVSVTGLAKGKNFNEMIKRVVASGADAIAIAHQKEARSA